MTLAPNRLRARLGTGTPVLGAWYTLDHPSVAEILCQAGYDTLLVDQEHSTIGLAGAQTALMAARAAGIGCFARVPGHDPGDVKRLLDLGMDGIMFPGVDSAEQAEACVAACHFPPRGIRGAATAVIRATRFGLEEAAYLDRTAGETVVICQIESRAAVAAIPAIAAVPGVDVLFIGPTDLSASLGKLAHWHDPEVRDTILAAEAAIKATGRALGAIPCLGRDPGQMLAAGVDLLIAGHDIRLLRGAAEADVAAARSGR